MLLLTNKTIEKLKHDLVRDNLINFENLSVAEDLAEKNSTNLAMELVKNNIISENELLNFIEDKLHIPSVELEDYTPDINCLKYVPYDCAKEYNIFPLFKIEDVLTIAMSDPLNLFAINILFENSPVIVEPVVCSEISINNAIKNYYENLPKNNEKNWQEKLISENLTDELLQNIILNIFDDAILGNYQNIFMEFFVSDLKIFFDKSLKTVIPAIIATRFLSEFKNITNMTSDDNDVIQNVKYIYQFEENNYPFVISLFPATFGTRISITINKPVKSIEEYNIQDEVLSQLTKKPQFISIKTSDKNLFYSLADYFSKDYRILMVENKVLQELQTITQYEFNKNTAIYFDEIINQIEFQKFDIIFWEDVYTAEQFEKLKLLAKNKIIITKDNPNSDISFDLTIDGG